MCPGPAEAEPAGRTDTHMSTHRAERCRVRRFNPVPRLDPGARRPARATAHPSFACLFHLGPQRIGTPGDTLPDTPRSKVPQPSGWPHPAGTHRVNHHTELLSPDPLQPPATTAVWTCPQEPRGAGDSQGAGPWVDSALQGAFRKGPRERRTFVNKM